MKFLIVFTDMVRSNRLKSCNSKINKNTPIDDFIEKIGGTIYSECFSPTPDTPRGLACIYSGLGPYYNGCDLRIKYPKYYLNKKTFFDLFLEKKYKINCFSNTGERKTGIFPENIDKLNIHNENYNLDEYLKNIKINENHLLFVSIPDLHNSLSYTGANFKGESEGYKQLNKSLNIIYNNFDINTFDHTLIFSDHGFKFYDEWFDYKRDLPLLLNEDRINSFMFHRKKGDKSLNKNDELIGTTNIYGFIDSILNSNDTSKLSIINNNKYVVGEDHLNFNTEINQWIGIWYYIDRHKLYVRTFKEGYLFKRNSNKYVKAIDTDLDNAIANETQFKDYLKRIKILNMYNKSMKEKRKRSYANGELIKTSNYPNLINKIKIIYDIILMKLNK